MESIHFTAQSAYFSS